MRPLSICPQISQQAANKTSLSNDFFICCFPSVARVLIQTKKKKDEYGDYFHYYLLLLLMNIPEKFTTCAVPHGSAHSCTKICHKRRFQFMSRLMRHVLPYTSERAGKATSKPASKQKTSHKHNSFKKGGKKCGRILSLLSPLPSIFSLALLVAIRRPRLIPYACSVPSSLTSHEQTFKLSSFRERRVGWRCAQKNSFFC